MAATTFNEHTMPYDAIVFIEGTSVVALDRDGDKIASGTNGTDDSTVIQAAISALPARGGIVYIGSGVYEITATLVIPNTQTAVTLRGAVAVRGVMMPSMVLRYCGRKPVLIFFI